MITQKTSLYNPRIDLKDILSEVDKDLTNLFNVLSGRVRMGSGADGTFGENIQGQFQEFTSAGAANTEFSVTHTLGSIPVGRIILWQNLAGHLYQGPTTGTAWTDTTVFFKCDVASVTFKVFLLQ